MAKGNTGRRIRIRSVLDGEEFVGDSVEIVRQMQARDSSVGSDARAYIREVVQGFGDVHGVALCVSGESVDDLCVSFVSTLVSAGIYRRVN